MPRQWRFVRDLGPNIRRGTVLEMETRAVRSTAEAHGYKLHEVACPSDIPLHYLERQERRQQQQERDAEIKSIWQAIKEYLK